MREIGAWGTDTTGGVTKSWAVIDHNSDFSVVPEPATCVLLGLGLSVALALTKRRRLG